MTNANVTALGGNQYEVEIDGVVEQVDLDGCTIMTDSEYEEVEQAGMLSDDMECPASATATGVVTDYELAAIEYAANYSGFIAADYISDNR